MDRRAIASSAVRQGRYEVAFRSCEYVESGDTAPSIAAVRADCEIHERAIMSSFGRDEITPKASQFGEGFHAGSVDKTEKASARTRFDHGADEKSIHQSAQCRLG